MANAVHPSVATQPLVKHQQSLEVAKAVVSTLVSLIMYFRFPSYLPAGSYRDETFDPFVENFSYEAFMNGAILETGQSDTKKKRKDSMPMLCRKKNLMADRLLQVIESAIFQPLQRKALYSLSFVIRRCPRENLPVKYIGTATRFAQATHAEMNRSQIVELWSVGFNYPTNGSTELSIDTNYAEEQVGSNGNIQKLSEMKENLTAILRGINEELMGNHIQGPLKLDIHLVSDDTRIENMPSGFAEMEKYLLPRNAEGKKHWDLYTGHHMIDVDWYLEPKYTQSTRDSKYGSIVVEDVRGARDRHNRVSQARERLLSDNNLPHSKQSPKSRQASIVIAESSQLGHNQPSSELNLGPSMQNDNHISDASSFDTLELMAARQISTMAPLRKDQGLPRDTQNLDVSRYQTQRVPLVAGFGVLKLKIEVLEKCRLHDTLKTGGLKATQPSESVVRCECGMNVTEDLMLQCLQCGSWQHPPCYGYIPAEATYPEAHLCYTCIIGHEEISDHEIVNLCIMRRILAILYTTGFPRTRSGFCKLMGLSSAVGYRWISLLKNESFIKPHRKLGTKDFSRLGERCYKMVVTEKQTTFLVQRVYNPTLHMRKYFQCPSGMALYKWEEGEEMSDETLCDRLPFGVRIRTFDQLGFVPDPRDSRTLEQPSPKIHQAATQKDNEITSSNDTRSHAYSASPKDKRVRGFTLDDGRIRAEKRPKLDGDSGGHTSILNREQT